MMTKTFTYVTQNISWISMIDLWKKIKNYGHPLLIFYILGIMSYRIFNYVISQDSVEIWVFFSIPLFSLGEILFALIMWISIDHAKNKDLGNETSIIVSEKMLQYLDDENYRVQLSSPNTYKRKTHSKSHTINSPQK